jgi:far upstream element-binding protein
MSDDKKGSGYVPADLSNFDGAPAEEEQHREHDTKRKRDEEDDETHVEVADFKKTRPESSPPSPNASLNDPDGGDKGSTAKSVAVAASSSTPSASAVTAYTAASIYGPAVTTTASTPSTTTIGSMEVKTEITEISQDKVGQVIGSKGAIIQDLQSRTGCKIQVNQDFPPGHPRHVVYTGTQLQIDAAKQLVALVIEKGPTAIHMLNGPVMTQIIECHQSVVGRVIGTGGSVIRDIQARCGVKIQVHQDFPDGVPRKVEITGNQKAVQMAAAQVRQIMEGGPMPGMGGIPGMGGPMGYPGAAMGGMPGAPVTIVNGAHVIDCPKQFVGRIIGRGGETINLLQSKSGARVQIEQNVPEGMPCKVNITGSPETVSYAIQMVQDVMANGPQRMAMYPPLQPAYGAPPAGGGFYGAPAGQGMYGAPYGAPQMMGAPAAYGGGYGAQPAPAAAASAYGGGYYGQSGGAPAAGGGARAAPGWGQGAPGQSAYAAPVAKPPGGLPPGWSEHKTDDGTPYWYNAATGVSQWERPK